MRGGCQFGGWNQVTTPTTLAPLTGSLRRPADQQASLWVRDWVEQQKQSATEAVDQTAEVGGGGGGGLRRPFSPFPFPDYRAARFTGRFFFFAFFFLSLAWSQRKPKVIGR